VANTHAFIDKRYEMLQGLGSQPSGCRREELAPGMRSFPFGRYVISTTWSQAIEIVRVLLGGRDTEVFLRSRKTL
jgi:plasmid stabilization system protein ParE